MEGLLAADEADEADPDAVVGDDDGPEVLGDFVDDP